MKWLGESLNTVVKIQSTCLYGFHGQKCLNSQSSMNSCFLESVIRIATPAPTIGSPVATPASWATNMPGLSPRLVIRSLKLRLGIELALDVSLMHAWTARCAVKEKKTIVRKEWLEHLTGRKLMVEWR